MSVDIILDALEKVRQQKPLVVNITNYVVMNTTANALLAIGASPIMAHSQSEMEDMMRIADALVINIGTLDSVWIPRMRFAIDQANRFEKPIVLDPVGCGATGLRTALAKELASLAQRLIIRANAAEVIALSGDKSQTKGVDSLDSSDVALNAARNLVSRYNANVVISGETDYIITGERQYSLRNGSAMMPFVTGSGCSLSALTGAFAAIGERTGLAAAAVMGIAGELAALQSNGPGTLQVKLLDSLYAIDSDTISRHIMLES